MKPSKILKLQHRHLGQGPFKQFIRQRIGEGSPIAIQWRKNKGYSEDWVNLAKGD